MGYRQPRSKNVNTVINWIGSVGYLVGDPSPSPGPIAFRSQSALVQYWSNQFQAETEDSPAGIWNPYSFAGIPPVTGIFVMNIASRAPETGTILAAIVYLPPQLATAFSMIYLSQLYSTYPSIPPTSVVPRSAAYEAGAGYIALCPSIYTPCFNNCVYNAYQGANPFDPAMSYQVVT